MVGGRSKSSQTSYLLEGSRDYIQGDIFPGFGAVGLVVVLCCFLGNAHILFHLLPIKPDTKADTKRYACNVSYASDAVNKPLISSISRRC